MKLVDLSVPLETGVASDPPGLLPKITYLGHDVGADEFTQMFSGLAVNQLRDGAGPAHEWIEATTHNGTHMDAPWHYHPTMDGGKRAITIDEVPLEWCFGDGVKLDFRDKPDGWVCSADDVAEELTRIRYELKPFDIVLINTAAGAAYGKPNYLTVGCGMGREATLYLLERGVRVTGIDAWSWDAPFAHTARKFRDTGNADLIWEGHKAGADIGYCHMEKLSNLECLPSHGFKICCFPIKVRSGSAGWVRAVAIL